jgi:hypothetical protein
VSRKLKVHNTQAQVEWTQLGAAVKKRPKKGQEVLDIWQGSNPEYFWNLWNDRLSTGNLQNRYMELTDNTVHFRMCRPTRSDLWPTCPSRRWQRL